MNFPLKETILVDIGITVIVLAILIILFLALKIVLKIFKKKEKEKKTSDTGCFGCLTRWMFIITLLSLGAALISFSAFLQSFETFTKQKLVAEIQTEEIVYNDYTMRFTITQKFGPNADIPRQFYLKGERWFVEGDVLKWKNWINFMGLHTMYRITRVGGDYLNTEDELNKKRTIYNVVNREKNKTWIWLQKFGSYVPFIQDAYGVRISHMPAEDKIIYLYVTTSGFSTEPVNMK